MQAFIATLDGLDDAEQRRALADAGYLAPQWPKPWGRDAGAVEQLVIDDEFRAAKVRRPGLMVGGWALPPLMVYGTEEQQRALDPADAARRDRVVPALQRAGRRLGPRRRSRRAPSASTAAGS